MGLLQSSSRLLNTFYAIWNDLGFLPEEMDYAKLYAGQAEASSHYPLRPELIESTYHQYRGTQVYTQFIAVTCLRLLSYICKHRQSQLTSLSG